MNVIGASFFLVDRTRVAHDNGEFYRADEKGIGRLKVGPRNQQIESPEKEEFIKLIRLAKQMLE